MTWIRALIFVLAAAFAVEAGIFYGLIALGAGEDLLVEVEMIWLCIASFFGVGIVSHFDRDSTGRH